MSADYYRLREIEEEEAAERASSDTARHAHRRMAALYAAKVERRADEQILPEEVD